MNLEVFVGNHQESVTIPESWLCALEETAPDIASLALQCAACDDSPLSLLATLDVALVDDPTSAQVHADFMGLDDPTDVITFHHGEIVIGAEVALRQANDYQEPLGREILRYLVHGVLHLAGHEDIEPAERALMEAHQEEIVRRLWTPALAARLG
jgi:probable rRNA maturation factor